MSRLATMGTFSCATIAVSGFKDGDVIFNKEYEADPDKFVLKTEGMSVEEFYSKVLFPVSQPLGKTKEYPFSMLMNEIDKSKMHDKFTILVLNEYQYSGGYWTEVVKKFGFELIDKTKNNIGSINYIFTRNKARRK